MKIPFLSLAQQYQALKPQLDDAIERVLGSGQYVGGPEVKSFEQNFANWHRVAHCISAANGTDTLFGALKALGIGPGDEVITPAWSWISSSDTITLAGATPVFADVDYETFTLSPEGIEKKITPRTRAVMAVHLYGQCCNLSALSAYCEKHNLFLIEDCAQAHGATHGGRPAGTWGHFGSFSFYPTKNLGALGEGGCLLTHNGALAEKARRFFNHGGLNKDDHQTEGMNSRLDAIQAAVLNAKLPFLTEWNARRHVIATRFSEALKNNTQVKAPALAPNGNHVFHLYVVKVANRDAFIKKLAAVGIETMIHYPSALPFEPAYARFNFTRSDFPVAWQLQQEVVSIPCHPFLSDAEVQHIAATLQG